MGLTTALHLAERGYKVTVLEKADHVATVTFCFKQSKLRFELFKIDSCFFKTLFDSKSKFFDNYSNVTLTTRYSINFILYNRKFRNRNV
jgi:protoporphyrinogen oxidase